MMITNIKKEVTEKWSNDFKDLSVYAQGKMYKILGPFLIGLELLNVPRTEDYRPIVVCYPLWKLEVKECLNETICTQEIYDKQGFQFNIPYIKNNAFFQDAVECTKKQVIILGRESVSLNHFFEFIDRQFSQTLIKSSPVGQAKLFEGKLLGALYINNMSAVNEVFEKLNKISKDWPSNLFEWKYGNLDRWLLRLKEIISNQNEFLERIQKNKEEKKITKLYNSVFLK